MSPFPAQANESPNALKTREDERDFASALLLRSGQSTRRDEISK